MSKSSEVERNVSIVIKTFERPHCVERLYHSIRHFYPQIPVIIADDSKTPLMVLGGAKILRLPYNSGLSFGRNRLLDAVNTKYFLLADDDFVFTDRTDLSVPFNILESTDFDIVGIELLYSGWKKRIYRGSYEKKGSVLFQYQEKPLGHHAGYPVFHYVLNCFMARTKTIQKSPWDEAIKIGHEHDDFFLRLKEKNVLITHTDQISIDHYHEMLGEYKKIRENTASYKELFFTKHHLTDMKEIGRGFPYWQRKLDSFLKFIKLQNIVNNMIRKHRLKGSGVL